MRDDPEIACTGCGFGGESAGPVGFYDLGDEMCCDVHRVTAYCCAERRIRAAEKLLDVEEYEEELAALEALAEVEEEDEITGFLITRGVRAARIASARAALAWRRQRTSPPRCLRCGSTEVVPLERGEQILHPGCPGNGELYYRVFIVYEWRGAGDAYHREGRFLREALRDPHDRADIDCTGCNFGGCVWSTQGFYEVESGVRFPVRETTAWCLEEERLFAAEDLQSIEYYEEILAAREALSNIEREEARAILEWRRRRTDPPRCLSCGSTDIVPLPAKGGLDHPGCRGKGQLRYEQLVRHGWPGAGRTFDPNGHFVRYAD